MAYSRKIRERMRFQGVRGSKKYPRKEKIRAVNKMSKEAKELLRDHGITVREGQE